MEWSRNLELTFLYISIILRSDCVTIGHREYPKVNWNLQDEFAWQKIDSQEISVSDYIAKINEEAFRRLGKENSLFEGDIYPNPSPRGSRAKRDTVSSEFRKWPKNGDVVTVPYKFSESRPVTKVEEQAVADAVRDINGNSCIRFQPAKFEIVYVNIIAGSGCYSQIGRSSTGDSVSLAVGCGTKAVATHELLHTLGFYHEQARLDRDDYIEIFWNNIASGMFDQFNKHSPTEASSNDFPYDPKSIMHYGNKAFSGNGDNTIEWKQNRSLALGGSVMSDTDVGQLNKLYGCPYERCSTGVWYNIKTHICCGETVSPRLNNAACCGNVAYDNTTQFCYRVKPCGISMELVRNLAQCGSQYYDWSKYTCWNGILVAL